MALKPQTRDAYDPAITVDCERLLVTLLRGLGPWKNSIYLIGGLTPRYLVPSRPPDVPPHAGTMDVDIVVEMQMLADTEAYRTLEENLKRLGFERALNDKGNPQSWRWQTKTKHATLVLEFLADDPSIPGGKVRALPDNGGNISALHIPHSSIVFTHHQTNEITAELLDGGGLAKETIRFADIVSFTCLKAYAYDDRGERKDAHDMVYCLEHAPGGVNAAAIAIAAALEGPHKDALAGAIAILRNRFLDSADAEGYRKDGPVSVAVFELGDDDSPDALELRLLRQRNVVDIIQRAIKPSP